MNHIFLTGFMGAGKSTVGRILADILNQDFIDLDDLIVQSEGVSIKSIFSNEGEQYFLEKNRLILLDLVLEVFFPSPLHLVQKEDSAINTSDHHLR